jgi:hypothetical protein
VAIEGRALQSLASDLSPRGTLSGSLLGGGLAACAHRGPLGGCFVGLFGAQRLSSADVAEPNASWGPYVALGPRLSVRLPLSEALSLEIALEALFDLHRNEAQLGGASVWTAPLVSPGGFLGLSGDFP